MANKKPYSTPQLVRVELNHEQAILSVCSTMTTAISNAGSSRCNATGFLNSKRFSVALGDSGPRRS